MFHIATDTVTDLSNTEHVGNRQQDAMLPTSRLLHPADRFDSEGWFISDHILKLFRVFLVKKHAYLSENTQFSGFLFIQVVQKH